LASDALEVLRTLLFIEKQIPTKDGRWFSIRIMPYRTFDDRIDGLVITFINHSDIKQVEIKLHETEQIHRLILNSSSDIILHIATDFKIMEFNPEAEKFFGKKQKNTINQNFIQMFVPEKEQGKVVKEWNELLNSERNFNYKMHLITAEGNIFLVEWTANVLFNNQQKPIGMILLTKNKNLL
jgi:two-component system CheB/CheR fusion protein